LANHNPRYDFEYEDDDDGDAGVSVMPELYTSGVLTVFVQDASVDIENKYYNAKQLKSENPSEAIVEFLGVPSLEEEKGDWGFKGLKQAIKIEFTLGRYEDAVKHYKELLTYVKSAVTRNYSEKSINNMLDYIEKVVGQSGAGSNGATTTTTQQQDSTAYKSMEEFYSLTLSTFQATNNERLALKTNLKLAKLYLDKKDYTSLTNKVREIHSACQKEDGTDDPAKGTYSLEAYALEIQMYAEMKNNKRLKSLYHKALTVRSAVPHPKVQGIIRECGGKMHMSEENWNAAQSDFFESFKNYDEAGSMQRIQVLKYVVLTTMLMKSTISPFDSQETKPYKNDPRISAMTDLVDAYQRDDIHRYENILRDNQDLLADSFIAENIDEVSRNMRTKAILKLIAPYTRFTLQFIAKHIKISVAEVQDILGVLIVDMKLKAKINQENGTVLVESSVTGDTEHLKRLNDWTHEVEKLWSNILNEGEGFKIEESSVVGGPSYPGGMNFSQFDPAAGIPSRAGKRGGTRGKGGAKLVGPV
jgi:COP9 signalosome complex subunit 2